jgi:2-oxoisovalerate dehydrogenase E2 component (dihydrolipoyl transacylase)
VVTVTRVKEFALPDLGEGLTEGEILKWLVAEGDDITLNQPIVEVETAKAAVEIPAKWAGRVTRLFHPEGATVEVGMAIIAIDTDPTAGPVAEIPPPEGAIEPGMIGGLAPGGRTAVLVGYGPKTTTAARRARKGTPTQESTLVDERKGPSFGRADQGEKVTDSVTEGTLVHTPVEEADPILAKPPVRLLARELGVSLAGVTGSGPAGSITREDVQAAATPETEPVAPRSAPAFGVDRERRVPVKGVRKLTAENMVASAFTAPHVTEFLTVDVTRSMKALERLRDVPDWRGVRVSPLLMVAKAVLLAVRRHPMINSTWSAASAGPAPQASRDMTGEIVVKEYVNLGIAAATPRGLVVPNIKDAGRLSLRELADAMTGLVSVAKEGRTAPADMSGGTFTISNVGVFGVDTGTPILPPGEAAILVFGAIRPMPWVHKGRIRVRDVTTLGLSFDHRIIDGELGSKFLRDLGAFLGDPEACLLAWA